MMTPISDSKYFLGTIFCGPSRSPRTSAGFTLLELLLVLTILGMASILVVPSLGSLESRTFSAQVREATSLLNYSRRIAVVSGQPSTASFFIAAASEDNLPNRASRSSVGRWESVGTGVRYRDSTDEEIEILDNIEITFYPEGGSTGGTLLLSQENTFVSINVNPFTGRVTKEYQDEFGDPVE